MCNPVVHTTGRDVKTTRLILRRYKFGMSRLWCKHNRSPGESVLNKYKDMIYGVLIDGSIIFGL